MIKIFIPDFIIKESTAYQTQPSHLYMNPLEGTAYAGLIP